MSDLDEFERETILRLQSEPWQTTVDLLWGDIFTKSFAPFQEAAWDWAEEILPGESHDPLVTIWARAAAKSTTAETILAWLGIMGRRSYGWYVCATQASANDHLQSISQLLTAPGVDKYFPSMSNRKMTKFGKAQGWRGDRLVTGRGFAVDAIGLDTAIRGRRIDDMRPDFIILDDIDEQYDTPDATNKKIDFISKKIILAGAPHVIVYGAQNLITSTGMFAQLADGTSKILKNAVISGPIPAIDNLIIDDGVIKSGKATWPSVLGLKQCQNLIDNIGQTAFMVECQHDVHQAEGALWTREIIHYSDLPNHIDEYCIGIDPAMSNAKTADETGIYVSAISDDNIYVVEQYSGRHHVNKIKQIAYDLWVKFQCEIHIEVDQGGQWLVEALQVEGVPANMIIPEKSGGVSKRGRAQPLADRSKERKLFLTKPFPTLENQMLSWVPRQGAKSPDHLDAMVWSASKWIAPMVAPARGYSYAWRI